ncbi:hypothetical protein BGX38DRAFT_1188964 [Terfezia claveryi]|nr:hypothetical protein BGX38DRAFT_1188964 [Terfezia claveryi]
MQQLDSLRDDKKETISISRISRTIYNSFLDEIGLQRRVVEIDVPPTKKRIYPFVWGDRKEDAHVSEYMKWITENVTIPSYATLYNASKDSNLLSSTSASTKFNFNVTLDLAIVAAKYERCGYPSGGVFMGIEVKKNVEPRNDMQAVVELVLADIPSEYPVIMLLTDLGSIWRYFWFQMGIIASCQFDLPRGIAFLGLLANEFKSSTTSIPAMPASASASPHNRCKFRYAIERDNDVHETTTPSEGIEYVLKRPKIDWMTILPESDVADMRQVFDVMSPSEVLEWKSRKVVDFLIKTPALQSTVRGTDWELMYA